MGLETSSCCPPTETNTSSVLRDEGRCAAASLCCAASVSRGSLAQWGRSMSSALIGLKLDLDLALDTALPPLR